MAANVSNLGENRPRRISNHDVVATALQAQLSLVSSYNRWLLQRTEVDGDRNGIISRVQRRLDDYKQWIHKTEAISNFSSGAVEPWLMDARTAGLAIVVTGPGLDDQVEIAARDGKELEYLMSIADRWLAPQDKYLGYMIKICRAFDQAQNALVSLLQTAEKMERESSQLRYILRMGAQARSQSPTSQPAEVTVQAHIRRLKEYNDVKDIGQQLIGLIAENRGAPIGSLYESRQYGVTADD
ncbi:DNA repair protein SWI5 [Madurella mycetomatis]|uniref:DNA repair protein SWI5 n=1 Tax=Madurella mycetomatis TaxID=100816 RepID=A0A175W559_9PEZI|nr:DNA repair protein SWI5 [Madurella mycetomatis]